MAREARTRSSRELVVVDADVLEHGPREEVAVLEDEAYGPAPEREVELVEGAAVDEDLAALRPVEAAEEADGRRLARARGSDQGRGRAEGHGEGDVLEDPVLALVGEPDAAELDGALEGGLEPHDPRAGLWLQVEDAEDALEGDPGLLDAPHVLGDAHDRVEESRAVVEEDEEGAEAHRAAEYAWRHEDHHGGHEERTDEESEAAHRGDLEDARLGVVVAEGGGLPVEGGLGPLHPPEGLEDLDPLHELGHRGRDASPELARPLVEGPEPVVVEDDSHDHEGDADRDPQGDRGLQGEADRDHAREEEEAHREGYADVREKFLHLLAVALRPRHELAYRVLVEVGDGQGEEVGEDFLLDPRDYGEAELDDDRHLEVGQAS